VATTATEEEEEMELGCGSPVHGGHEKSVEAVLTETIPRQRFELGLSSPELIPLSRYRSVFWL
jgi:hypothetical protein